MKFSRAISRVKLLGGEKPKFGRPSLSSSSGYWPQKGYCSRQI